MRLFWVSTLDITRGGSGYVFSWTMEKLSKILFKRVGNPALLTGGRKY